MRKAYVEKSLQELSTTVDLNKALGVEMDTYVVAEILKQLALPNSSIGSANSSKTLTERIRSIALA